MSNLSHMAVAQEDFYNNPTQENKERLRESISWKGGYYLEFEYYRPGDHSPELDRLLQHAYPTAYEIWHQQSNYESVRNGVGTRPTPALPFSDDQIMDIIRDNLMDPKGINYYNADKTALSYYYT